MKASKLQENHKTTYITSLDNLMPLIREQLSNGRSVHFAPKGKSMLPMLKENRDSVVLSPVSKKLKKYDLPLYQRDNGQFVLHRVVELKNTYTMMGDNQCIKEQGIRHEQIIGLVTTFYRNGKEHSVEEPGYKIYCRIWYYSRRVISLMKRVAGKCWRIVKWKGKRQ